MTFNELQDIIGVLSCPQELQNADEDPVPYDQMTQRSKDLLNDMREYEELLAAGEIDPDDDDYNIVLGEGDDAL